MVVLREERRRGWRRGGRERRRTEKEYRPDTLQEVLDIVHGDDSRGYSRYNDDGRL